MNFLIILVAAAICQFTALPWWTIAVVPAIVHIWRPTSYGSAFIQSCLAVGLLWFGYALYIQINSQGAMSDRMAQVFSLPNGYVLLGISTIVGALVAGTSGMAGYSIRTLFKK